MCASLETIIYFDLSIFEYPDNFVNYLILPMLLGFMPIQEITSCMSGY